MITDITIKVRADLQEEAFGSMENTKEYVDTEPGKYFHVIITAKFSQDFEGKLRLEISHKRSGFMTYEIVNNPPKGMLAQLGPDDIMCFVSPGIRISRLIGQNYRPPLVHGDYVDVKLYLDNKEIESKSFAIRGSFS